MTAENRTEDSLTPIGDWLRNRYPPNDGATHWLGRDGSPGCCAGDHPICLYEVAFREGARTERARTLPLLRSALRDAIRACEADAEDDDPEAPDFLAEYQRVLADLLHEEGGT